MARINQAYGKYQNGFDITFYEEESPVAGIPPVGLFVIHGNNSSGKTTVLRAIGGYLARQVRESVLYIPAERTGINISNSQVVNGSFLGQSKVQFENLIASNNTDPAHWRGYAETLATAMLSEDDDTQRSEVRHKIFSLFGIQYRSTNSTWQTKNDQSMSSDGSGLKAVYFVLAALSTNTCSTIIIDEPELSLESGLQKQLYSLIEEKASTHRIIIATHSPHFINKKQPTCNFIIESSQVNAQSGYEEPVIITPQTDLELYEKVIIDKIGFSLQDVFLPEKIILVEGESDRIILNAIFKQMNIFNIFIHKIKGINDYTANRLKIIEESLSPHFHGDEFYLYKGKVAILTDYLDPESKLKKELERHFSDYWFQISDTLESGKDILNALPEEIYTAAELDKTIILQKIVDLELDKRNNWDTIQNFKVDTAIKLSDSVTYNIDHLLKVPGIRKVVDFIRSN